ncbi:MAG: sigma-54-dependent Fis family transcriptional regulator [Gammaproteobacteria bacterium]|nr:sigma-54-dependent Fis family transcriptional regulator [Gammaproteobacteria bacterium]
MTNLQILVIEDETALRQVLCAQLRAQGFSVEQASTGEAALRRLTKGDVDVALCDIRLPDIDGIEVMRRSIEAGVDTAFLVMTAFASVSTAIDAMKNGAYDYLVKPVQEEDLLHRITQMARLRALSEENKRLRTLVPDRFKEACALPSAAARNVTRLATRVARTEGTVLITGESGTGKGIIAQVIHRQSPRAAAQLVNVNCGAIPKDLLESEFFGHLKGAFTGADRAKKGLMLEADGGTLLLDEIAELPLEMQVKLLHAIEDKQVRPVGSERSRQVDVRILAATNRDLQKMVEEGQFREDLYYRLNVLQIELPPLRERPQDVVALVRYFLDSSPPRLGLQGCFSIEPEAEELLLGYHWPGNIRELQNVMDRALILTESNVIGVADLPHQVTRQSQEIDVDPVLSGSLRERTRQFEIRAIEQAIEDAGGDRRTAARRLGIGLSTLYRKLEEPAQFERQTG